MRLIVGLGNHPEKYKRTRHNVGFIALEALAKKYSFSAFKREKKFKGEVAYGEIKGEKTILLKPHTLMNLSGEAVQAVMQFYRLSLTDLWVLSDDLDQDFGAFRLREKGSDGGQKGLRDVAQKLGSQNFFRLKFGINNDFRARYDTADFVLGKFTTAEWEALPGVVKAGIERLESRWW